MILKDLLESKQTKVVHSINSNQTVFDAAQLMEGKKIGFLMVFENEEPVGVLSERDIVYRSTTSMQDPQVQLVSDIMSKNMIWAHEETELRKALEIMKKNHFRHLPIRGANNKLIDILSERDITTFLFTQANK